MTESQLTKFLIIGLIILLAIIFTTYKNQKKLREEERKQPQIPQPTRSVRAKTKNEAIAELITMLQAHAENKQSELHGRAE